MDDLHTLKVGTNYPEAEQQTPTSVPHSSELEHQITTEQRKVLEVLSAPERIDLSKKTFAETVEFLLQLTHQKYVFHGSPVGDISVLEPRQAKDEVMETVDTAVFATDNPLIALFRSVYGPHLRVWTNHIFFATDQPAREKGYIYVFDREKFRDSASERNDELHAYTAVTPDKVITVSGGQCAPYAMTMEALMKKYSTDGELCQDALQAKEVQLLHMVVKELLQQIDPQNILESTNILLRLAHILAMFKAPLRFICDTQQEQVYQEVQALFQSIKRIFPYDPKEATPMLSSIQNTIHEIEHGKTVVSEVQTFLLQNLAQRLPYLDYTTDSAVAVKAYADFLRELRKGGHSQSDRDRAKRILEESAYSVYEIGDPELVDIVQRCEEAFSTHLSKNS